jgi:hypothetical protein
MREYAAMTGSVCRLAPPRLGGSGRFVDVVGHRGRAEGGDNGGIHRGHD